MGQSQFMLDLSQIVSMLRAATGRYAPAMVTVREMDLFLAHTNPAREMQ